MLLLLLSLSVLTTLPFPNCIPYPSFRHFAFHITCLLGFPFLVPITFYFLDLWNNFRYMSTSGDLKQATTDEREHVLFQYLLLYSVHCLLVPCSYLQLSWFNLPLLLNSLPMCIWPLFPLPVHQLKDICLCFLAIVDRVAWTWLSKDLSSTLSPLSIC